MEEQIPIFIPLDEIAEFPEPMEMPDDAGRLALKAKGDTLHGYRCKDITSEYMWNRNGCGKGFEQTLMCRYAGSMANFNFMMRRMNNKFQEEHCFIVLLPRENGPYCVFGNRFREIDIADSRVEHQTLVLKNQFQVVPFPYYDGPVCITDVTAPQLMEHLYGKKD